MSAAEDRNSDFVWPAEGYVDEDGDRHAWDDLVPLKPGEYGEPGTYRELVVEMASAQDLSVAEYLGLDEDDDTEGEDDGENL